MSNKFKTKLKALVSHGQPKKFWQQRKHVPLLLTIVFESKNLDNLTELKC